MRKFIVAALALGLMGLSVPVYAGDPTCPQGTKLRLLGTVRTTTGGLNGVPSNYQVTTAGANVRMVVLLCGGTACTVGLANTDLIGSAVAADYVLDIGAAANATLVLDFTDQGGIDFSEGISYASADGNLTALSLFSCQ